MLNVEEINDARFPGLSKIEEQLSSWEWVYGMNPPFTLLKRCSRTINKDYILKVDIEKGRITKVWCKDEHFNRKYQDAVGMKFHPDIWDKMYSFEDIVFDKQCFNAVQ